MKKSLLVLILLLLTIPVFSQNPDIDLLKQINLNRNRQLDVFFKIITDSVSLIAYGVPAILLGIGVFKRLAHLRERFSPILISVAFAGMITTLLKYIISRPRPFLTYTFLEKMTSGGGPSFPSGHTTDAFSFAIALCLAYPKWYVVIPVLAWAALVGYSRMFLGVHYPSDVFVAALIGTCSAWFIYKINPILIHRKRV